MARRLNTLSAYLFADGISFFGLPFVVYLAFWWTGAPVPLLKRVFLGVHVVSFALFLNYLRCARPSKVALAFWSCMAIVFLVPGAYLEFPSDAWEHFRRLMVWDHCAHIATCEYPRRFAYFWGNTLLPPEEILNRRVFLGIYSAFWQWVLCIQVFRFARRIGFETKVAWLQVAGFVLLFGHNVFGIRYYALSATLASLAVYFAALVCVLDWVEKRKAPWHLLLFAPLMILNHAQEFFFFCLSTAVIGIDFILRTRAASFAKYRRQIGAALVVAAAISSPLVWKIYREKRIFYGVEFFTVAGTLRFWKRYPYLETVGVSGILGLIAAIARFRVFPRLAALSLAPALTLVCPLAIVFFSFGVSDAWDTYRVLYAMPLSFALVAGLLDTLGRWQPRFAFGITCVCVIALSLFPRFPWRGKLFAQVYRVPANLSLEPLDATLAWLSRERPALRECGLVTDEATKFFLLANWGLPGSTARRKPLNPIRGVRHLDDLSRIITRSDACGVLIAVRAMLPDAVRSPISQLSSHWIPEATDLRWQVPPELEKAAAQLESLKWTRVFVPPFYTLYEPPNPRPIRWAMLAVTEASMQADAHLLRFPDGRTFMIDAGDPDGALVGQLEAREVRKIDRVVLSHPHRDHYEGLFSIIESGIQVADVVLNLPSEPQCRHETGWGCDWEDLQRLRSFLAKHHISLHGATAGDVLYENQAVRLEVLFAYDGSNTPVGQTSINGQSLVIRLSNGEMKALFTGDLDFKLGTYLASQPGLRSDILKMPHHGAESLAPDGFFDAVAPTLALIPAPKKLWADKLSDRTRSYLVRKKIPFYVSGINGGVTVELFRDHFTATSERPAIR